MSAPVADSVRSGLKPIRRRPARGGWSRESSSWSCRRR